MRKILTIIKFFTPCALLFLSASCHANEQKITGKWIKESKTETLSLTVTKKGKKNYLTYCFIFASGNRINCGENDSNSGFRLDKTEKENCYHTKLHSYYDPEVAADVTVCAVNNYLYWRIYDAKTKPYLPSNIKFERDRKE